MSMELWMLVTFLLVVTALTSAADQSVPDEQMTGGISTIHLDPSDPVVEFALQYINTYHRENGPRENRTLVSLTAKSQVTFSQRCVAIFQERKLVCLKWFYGYIFFG
ncbi:hypothetical protein ElyMa_001578800 [Elysia marginata]|uniref:Cystatin domain-containing protein n=1 Tax=Elysia marginata TaxID=1093978 RepID=A0AAV4JD89_9GAST|nr:hypothetical protein ElyMa_001578800 [Elysia marginata]